MISPAAYAEGYPHGLWARLRRESPVARLQTPGFEPYWAISRHASIREISCRPDPFLNGPTMQVQPLGMEPSPTGRSIASMDPPEHRAYRRLASGYFSRRRVQRLRPRIEELTRQSLDQIADGGAPSECDFAVGVAAWLPLQVISEVLGVPIEDRERILDLTRRIMGGTDPEFEREAPGTATAVVAMAELQEYMHALAMKRRAEPRDDLGSILSAAEIDGRPLPDLELVSYYVGIAAAGHDTTRNAIAGGLLALLEHPAQLERLRREPRLVERAVEEILRWTSPVISFTRTAARDTELAGRAIRAGDRLTLFYPSANRDEDVFDEPDRFRIERHPNPHLAFGIGEHFCIGSHLARLELQVLFLQLLERMHGVELAGRVEWLQSSFVGGVKHLPIRYRMRPAAGATPAGPMRERS